MRTTANKIILFLFLSIIQSLNSFAYDSHELFTKAGKAYQDKDYAMAIKLYREILEKDYASSELYFNLGNAYFKADSLGRAIQFYEKAYKLNAGDEDLNYNIKMAQALTIDKIEPLPEFIIASTWKNFVNSKTADQWGIFSLITFSLIFGILIIFYISGSPNLKRIMFVSAILMTTVSVMFFILASSRKSNDLKAMKGVVLASSASVKSAPQEAGTSLFVIHEGTTFKILDKSKRWYRIRLDNGNSGWLSAGEIGVI